MRKPRGAGISALLALWAARAAANGRYPAASQIAFDPADPSHLVVSATIGLLESRDRGKTFVWRCEPILGSPGNEDVLVAVTASGTTVAATPKGLMRSNDGCSFDSVPELLGEIARDVSVSAGAPHRVLTIRLGSDAGSFDSQLLRSDDDGKSWSSIGNPLARDLLPLTIDAAPSDPSRVYVSARLGAANGFSSVLLRSADGGQTFSPSDIPETTDSRTAYIAAVHPLDPDRVYLRVYDTAGTKIWMSSDGGKTFRQLFVGADQLFGFAISPTGDEIAFGGPGDGIWVGASDGTGLTRRSSVSPTCLRWNGDGLYACADPNAVGFLVGRSTDEAATFETLVTFTSLCGHTGCAAETPSGQLCPPDWERVAPIVGASCGVDAGQRDADASKEVDAAADVAVDVSAVSAQNDGSVTTTQVMSSVDASGGGCQISTQPHEGAIYGALVFLIPRLRRRKTRST
jgi:hypothetical protein